MNKWIGIGRICTDVESKTTQDGKEIAKYRLAVNRPYSKDGQQEADFLNCVAFGKNAEFVNNYLHKGMKIAVEGSIQTGGYDKDGVRHYTTDIRVERCEFCESKNRSEDAEKAYVQQERQAIQQESQGDYMVVNDEELPF